MEYYRQNLSAPQIIRNQKVCFEPHFHTEIEIVFFYRGSALLVANGEEHKVGEGQCVIIFPNIIHSYRSEDNVDVGKFIFDISFSPELYSDFINSEPLSPVISAADAGRAGIGVLTKEIIAEYGQSSAYVRQAYLMLLAGKVLDLCELTASGRSASASSVSSVIQYCRTYYRDPDISIGSLSDALHISRSHISHIFSEKLKVSFRRYINIMRINDATRLLSSSDASVTEIAGAVGFGSLRNFDKAFYELMGKTPREYRACCSNETQKTRS